MGQRPLLLPERNALHIGAAHSLRRNDGSAHGRLVVRRDRSSRAHPVAFAWRDSSGPGRPSSDLLSETAWRGRIVAFTDVANAQLWWRLQLHSGAMIALVDPVHGQWSRADVRAFVRGLRPSRWRRQSSARIAELRDLVEEAFEEGEDPDAVRRAVQERLHQFVLDQPFRCPGGAVIAESRFKGPRAVSCDDCGGTFELRVAEGRSSLKDLGGDPTERRWAQPATERPARAHRVLLIVPDSFTGTPSTTAIRDSKSCSHSPTTRSPTPNGGSHSAPLSASAPSPLMSRGCATRE